jgi:hypothetical protein
MNIRTLIGSSICGISFCSPIRLHSGSRIQAFVCGPCIN